MSIRLIATYVLYDVIVGGRSLSAVLNEALKPVPKASDRGFCQELVFGTLRHYPSLQSTLRPFLKKAIPPKNKPLEIILCSALYQLLVMRLPSYAVINESVNATKSIDFEWATGFVNGVLRAISRDEQLILASDSDCNHPKWLADCIRATYPEQAETLFQQNLQSARLMLRVRPKHISRDAYLALLAEAYIPAEAHIDNKDAIVLATGADVSQLPHFSDGFVTVQDANAQLAANLLGVKSGVRVLDACAAPGGKTAHLFDKADNLHLVAVDNVPTRVAMLNQTLARLQVRAEVITADVAIQGAWQHGNAFERILLDAPCSATGVIRKHPDILFHRRESDIVELSEVQSRLLDACWQMLAVGGRLLYATCSILPSENHEQIQDFLARYNDATLRPLGHNRAISKEGMLQFLPDAHGDGFFYALLEKSA